MNDNGFDTLLETPQGQSPERTLYIDTLRAEIFGVNVAREAFVADSAEESVIDVAVIRRKARERRKLRRTRLAPRN